MRGIQDSSIPVPASADELSRETDEQMQMRDNGAEIL
jgi:hypothetical protein